MNLVNTSLLVHAHTHIYELTWLMDVMLGRVEAVLLARKSLVFPVLLSSETLDIIYVQK